jgi:hypothetical protein
VKPASWNPVPFSANLPAASDVKITGDFTRWTGGGIPLRNEVDGSWRTVLSLLPGIYEYRLIIDGDWADHGEALARVSNPYGGENCVLTVRRS